MQEYHGSNSLSSGGYPVTMSGESRPARPLKAYEYISTPPIQLILDAIAAHCSVGGTIRPGVRRLAAWANYASAGRISPLLDQLASDGWISYDPSTGLIMLLEDPNGASITPRDRWIADETDAADSEPITPRDRDPQHQDADDGSITPRDRSVQCMEDSCLATALVESAVVKTQIPCGAESIPARDHPILLLLIELGLTPGPGVFERGMAARDWTPQQTRDLYEYNKPRIENSGGKKHWGIFWTAFMAGELAPPRPDPQRPIDPAAYANDSLYRMGSNTSGQDAEAAADDSETPSQAARRILPPDASQDDWIFVTCRISQGDSEACALDELARHRKAAHR